MKRLALLPLLVALPCLGTEAVEPRWCGAETRAMTDPHDPDYPSLAAEWAHKLERAVRACELVVEPRPRNEQVRMDAAYAFALAGRTADALREARAAAELKSWTAPVLVSALMLQEPGSAPAAAAQLMAALRLGGVLAAYNAGVAHADGIGVERDEALAFRYFHGAARGRDATAMLEVGNRLLAGQGVPADRAEAEGWWRRAAESLALESRRHPARWPRLLPFDAGPALVWYRAQAAAGEPWAQTFLGLLHERGTFVAQDIPAALAWYRRAAERHHAAAEARLAILYSRGRGVPRDRAQARDWGSRAMTRACEAQVAAHPEVPACDRYAGDPYDPAVTWAGVEPHCMPAMAERAVAACTPAVKAAPGNARLRAQLARALAHRGRHAEARREAAIAAKAGSTAAMTLLAYMDELGYGGERDPAAAYRGYRAAAAAGESRAMRLALRLQQYRGVGNEAEARELTEQLVAASARVPREDPRAALLRRAGAGDPASQHNLAAAYEREGNLDEAVAWYRKAAAAGFGISLLNLAQMYEAGSGVARDPEEALRLYRKPAERGDAEAQWRSARLHGQRGAWAQAVPWLERLAAAGDQRGIVELGICYEEGKGVARDPRRALALYGKAARSSRWAQFRAGLLHYTGDGVPKDLPAALAAFRQGAGQGHGPAMNNLGVMLENGEGTAPDLAAAGGWYLRAMGAGSGAAWSNAQALYASGRGAPRDAAGAIAWYRPAAEAGVPAARYRLAMLYQERGATQDLREAARWHHANAGDPRSLRALARMYASGSIPFEGGGEGGFAARVVGAAYVAALLSAKADELEKHRMAEPGPAVIDTDAGADFVRDTPLRVAGVGQALSNAGGMGWSVVVMPPPPGPAAKAAR